MAMKVATVSNYGDETGVQLVVATIHRAEDVIEYKPFHREHFASEEEMIETVLDYVSGHRVQQVRQVGEMLPMEEAYCTCCGEIAGRISRTA
jgi:hypothetical protein